MDTTTKPETTESKASEVLQPQQSKDVTITFKVTEEQKKLLMKKAIDEAGITLTDFIKHKVFSEPQPQDINALENEREVFSDEEKTMLENLVNNKNNQILDLTNQVTALKASQIKLSEPLQTTLTTTSNEITNLSIENDSEIKSFYDEFMKNSNEDNSVDIESSNHSFFPLLGSKNIKDFDIKLFIKTCVLYNKHRLESNVFNRLSYSEFLIQYFENLKKTTNE